MASSLLVAAVSFSVGCKSSGSAGDDVSYSGGSFEERLANNQMYSGGGGGGRRSQFEKKGFRAEGKTKLRSDYRVSEFKSGEFRTQNYRGVSEFRTNEARDASQAFATSAYRGGNERALTDRKNYKTGEYATSDSRLQGKSYSTYDNVEVSNDRYLDDEPVDNIVPLSGREESFTFKDIKEMVGQ
ncbi:hypothetical protein [Sulfuriroseicoccus oceanibius]|uniref:Uncharacterized protein n=1 Tax=Sulfuriroseicoccus oceanibius TaxID=2707525 RepID=A0A6B3LEK6_9BACT|nr:hypothetical protein [Sulfuriroseicoccus oceanibius]QQL44929.1 hypothetical protein G3M56_013845 [Sulfuriroseicoccus oceanibius]